MSRLGRAHPADHVIRSAFLITKVNDADTITGVDAVATYSVSSSDSISTTDSQIITSSPITSDTISSADVSTSIQVTISGSDTISGLDSQAVIQSSSDLLSGVDASSLTGNPVDVDPLTGVDSGVVVPNSAEIGSFVDSGFAAIPVSSSDSFLGSDSSIAASSIFSSADAVQGADLYSPIASSLADTDFSSPGIDAVYGLSVMVSDSGVFTDSFILLPTSLDLISFNEVNGNTGTQSADIGSALDSQVVTLPMASADTVSGLENSLIAATMSSLDVASGVDSGTPNQGTFSKSDTDTASGIDSLASLPSALSSTDAVSSAEINVVIQSSPENINSAEALSLKILDSEPCSGNDSIPPFISFSNIDSASATDVAQLTVGFSDTDHISYNDSQNLFIYDIDNSLSVEYGSLSQAHRFDSDLVVGAESSVAFITVGSQIGIEWNVNAQLGFAVFSTAFTKSGISSSSVGW